MRSRPPVRRNRPDSGNRPKDRRRYPTKPTTTSAWPDPLTPREREVARLIARGETNRQIAATLVISERTADAHVQNILNKLGFSSRAQIAALAVERGLLANPLAEISDIPHRPARPDRGT